jgi:hypothetical protein
MDARDLEAEIRALADVTTADGFDAAALDRVAEAVGEGVAAQVWTAAEVARLRGALDGLVERVRAIRDGVATELRHTRTRSRAARGYGRPVTAEARSRGQRINRGV